MVLAEMSAGDLATVVVTLAAVGAFIALLIVLQRTLVALRATREALDEVNTRAVPLIEELAESLAAANEELARVERLVGSAESISATVDATSKLAYRALSAPVIKTVAVTSGASRAARRLRRE